MISHHKYRIFYDVKMRELKSHEQRGIGAMAQLVAHLLCKQRVPGSNPGSSTKKMSNATIKKTTRLLLLGVVKKKPALRRLRTPVRGVALGPVSYIGS